MIPHGWTPYRRAGDDELVGYLATGPDGTRPLTLLGSPLAAAGDRDLAVEVLEARGLASLAEPWLLRRRDGSEVRVAVLSAYPGRVLVAEAPFGFPDPAAEAVALDVPEETRRLRPLR